MGHLKQLESPTHGGVLFTFSLDDVAGNRGWERRNATVTIANTPWGSSPFLGTGAPAAPHRWRWSARYIPSRTGRSGDATVDILNRAMDLGRPVRLVYLHDDGYERICDAIGYLGDVPITAENSPFYLDIAVEWELLSPWRERQAVNPDRHAGAGFRSGETGLRAGGSAAVAITTATFALPSTMCDASVAGPGGIPTATDTGPIIRITGAYGGSGGFLITNAAPLGSVVAVLFPLLAGDTLTLDFGAKDYLLTRAGVTTDVSQLVSTDPVRGYDFAIMAGQANPITLTCVGNAPTAGATASIVVQYQRFFL